MNFQLPDGRYIEIGGRYQSRDGRVAIVTSMDLEDTQYPIKGHFERESANQSWAGDGKWNKCLDEHAYDLIGREGATAPVARAKKACRHPEGGDVCPLPAECHSPSCRVCPYGPYDFW